MGGLNIVALHSAGNAPRLVGTALWACVAAAGCASPAREPAAFWELASAVEVPPAVRWECRVLKPELIPPELKTRLSEEFTAVHIRCPSEWRRLQRILELGASDPPLDFSRGSIVGLLADVGEPSDHERWPVELEEVRVVQGAGWLRFRFASGLFYQVRTAPFFTAAYVPGLRQLRVVQINHRVYRLTPGPEPSLRAAF